MKIDSINRTNFGIKCLRTEKWDKEVYDTLMKSALVKEIDAKYPDASASYFLYKENNVVNQNSQYKLLFDLNLTKNKIWNCWLNGNNEKILPKILLKKLQKLTLSETETNLRITARQFEQIKMDEDLKLNPFKKFFKKFF